MAAIMQVVRKSINYKEHTAEVDLLATSYESTTTLVHADEGQTLETAATEEYVDEGILLDIKTKQEYVKSKYDEYETLIQDYATAWGFGTVTALSTHTYVYSTLDNSDIDENSELNDTLKNNIIQNELYFAEEREMIKEALWWIKSKHEERLKMGFGNVTQLKTVLKSAKNRRNIIAALVQYNDYWLDVMDGNTGDIGPIFSTYAGSGNITVTNRGNSTLYINTSIVSEPSRPTPQDYDFAITPGNTAGFSPAPGQTYHIKAAYGYSGTYIYGTYTYGTTVSATPTWDDTPDDTNEFGYVYSDRKTIKAGSNTTTTLYYTTDGTEPTVASDVLDNTGYTYSETHGAVKEIKIKHDDGSSTDLSPTIVVPLPGGGDSAANRGFIEFYDFSNDENMGNPAYMIFLANDGSTVSDMYFSDDGTTLILDYGTSITTYDVSDFIGTPIYRTYDNLTLDDILRVYP